MLILGISTSSKNPSAAIMRDGEIAAYKEDVSGRSHSETLLTLIEEAMAEAGTEKSALDAIAVDIGPGSFTGVRIGVSCANAMAFSLGISVIPVSSLRALAELGRKDFFTAAMIDCRNGNCYAALYLNGEDVIPPEPAEIKPFFDMLPDLCYLVGDCALFQRGDKPNAKLVLKAAEHMKDRAVKEAVPLYLRPSQAERMRGEGR